MRDESLRTELARLPMLRQQEVIADGSIAPKESLVLGTFAVTAGVGAEELAKQFERDGDADDFNAILRLVSTD